MKKILLIIISLILSISSFAQEHFKFKGIEINGTPQKIRAKLEAQGYNYVRTIDNITIMKGEFAGIPGCYIYISSTRNNTLTYEISVSFPSKDNWKEIHFDFINLSHNIYSKYKIQDDCLELHDELVWSHESPSEKFQKLLDGKANCYRNFYIKKDEPIGFIQLSMTVINGKAVIMVKYFDEINNNIKESAEIDDL